MEEGAPEHPARPAVEAANEATAGSRRIIAATTESGTRKRCRRRPPYPFAGAYALP